MQRMSTPIGRAGVAPTGPHAGPHPCSARCAGIQPCNIAPRSSSHESAPVQRATGAHSSRTAVLVAAAKSKGAGKGSTGAKGFGASNAPSVSKSGAPQTCACGSKSVYRECCEPYHLGAAVPADVESALRARFCAFVKGRVPYLLGTFHPAYHAFKYEGCAPGGAAEQLRRDVEAATKCFAYSNLKVLEVRPGSHPDEAFITFRYKSVNKANPETNIDGSIKISTTIERSRFLREPPSATSSSASDTASGSSAAASSTERVQHSSGDGATGRSSPARGAWLFADYELLDYPAWMEEAKQAERRARGQQGSGEEEAGASAAVAAELTAAGV